MKTLEGEKCMKKRNDIPLIKIISGGQTGADLAGITAARSLGLKTGGTAPPGFMTDTGPMYLLRNYGLVEGDADPRTYPKRTERNVADSDGTAVFSVKSSPGSRLTISLCWRLKKPLIINPSPEQLLDFVKNNNISILNIAGNRERVSPGIYEHVYQVITKAFEKHS